MSLFAACIFDMDGVIVDSTQIHTEAWIVYLRQHGIEIPDLEARMLGKHNDEIVHDFFAPRPLTPDEVFLHGARKEALYREMIGPILEQQLIPGIREFLRQLEGIPLAVATNAEAANVDFVLDRANLRHHFQAVVSGHDVKLPKPAPDIYLRAAEILNIPPASCIVFEDSLTGVLAGRAAGMRVVGLLTTLREIADTEVNVRDFRDSELNRWLSAVSPTSLSSR